MLALALALALAQEPGPTRAPNLIFVLADDLGYGDLGCFGQETIQTPRLDRLAAEGMRLTDFYAGSTVCAPSRCVLMTGLHSGHARVRGNARVPLEPGDVTLAELMRDAGYATALIGKWGLGEPGSTGVPNAQGFDYFYGYLNQRHAHDYYPNHLYRNAEEVRLEGNVSEGGVASERAQYSHDLVVEEALGWVRAQAAEPFFLYLALTIPHANNERGAKLGDGMEVPDYGSYADEEWPDAQKGHAAMISRMDRDVGRLMDLLEELEIGDDTLVVFTSDNGPHREGGAQPDFFHSRGGLRGIKRSLYEGGIRVPTIAHWPGVIEPGSTCAVPLAFQDVLPTACELAGVEAPARLDGISFLPALRGEPQPQHDYLYWEFHEGRFSQAIRIGPWKAVRTHHDRALELYDLRVDLAEEHDLAGEQPALVEWAASLLAGARTPNEHWPGR